MRNLLTPLVSLFSLTSLYGASIPEDVGVAVVPQDKPYYKHKIEGRDIELIYPKESVEFAKQAAALELPLNEDYEYFFDWKFDERLYVGLISDKNQMANGFSTQFPNNRQINYIGGSTMVDYFSSKSWLDTLIYHETAHNYQLNVKGSGVSQTMHSLFGNGSFLIPVIFTLPNLLLNSFMVEGNAVLNESWHGNGGRLYSGMFTAQTALQAKAGKITPEEMYNSRVEFPYGEAPYIQGGFYNLYLAKNYGLKNIDRFFKENSYDWWWPFFTNDAMKNSVGVDFEESLASFADEQKKIASKMTLAKGEPLASSQYFSSLSNSQDSIFFVTNESGRMAPELIVVDKESKGVTRDRESWLSGKVIKVDNAYYTQSSAKTSPMKISQGLFDADGYIKEGSDSKVVQAYLSNGEALYFDVASSYSEPHLYIGDTFYDVVNSSVIVDASDNLYYFKQDGKTRTLYKNREPLFSYEGFYGKVSDVDSKGSIYFVANSPYGSTLYKYERGDVSRVSSADNIVEARLINDSEVLIAAISDKDYYYVINKLESMQGKPFEVKLFFEEKPYYGAYKNSIDTKNIDCNESYNSFFDMHYSGVDASLGSSTTAGVMGELALNFGDPLSQNAANIFVSRDESNITIAGASYASALYLLQYGFSIYSVVDNDAQKDIRSSGVVANAMLPLYESAYNRVAVAGSYYQDYDALSRKPLSAILQLEHFEQYGVSMYANSENSLELYGVEERGDMIYGGGYAFNHDIFEDFYAGIALQYSQTNATSPTNDRGVKVSKQGYFDEMDPSAISMPSIDSAGYVKRAAYGEVNMAAVFNASAYYFTFPLSLQRESLYAKYRHYDILDFTDVTWKANEVTVGVTLATVLLNSLEMPLSFEYIYNDADFISQENSFRFLFGSSF